MKVKELAARMAEIAENKPDLEVMVRVTGMRGLVPLRYLETWPKLVEEDLAWGYKHLAGENALVFL
jgi:hypothetical protein